MAAINVETFLANTTYAYNGDSSFLEGPTVRTKLLWAKVDALKQVEAKLGGVIDVDASVPAGITSFAPGYIDEDLDRVVVGLQTDKPLKRDVHPKGGIKMVNAALKAYGFDPDPVMTSLYSDTIKTHNQGVFDVYTEEMRAARKSGILTGLPDGYGRGRIIGDYRRVPLCGVDSLVAAKRDDLKSLLNPRDMDEDTIRLREEVTEQIRALADLKEMASSYGFDISGPATNAREAVQWLYFAYLGAVKEQDGAAMSMGRIDRFLDAYIERDILAERITESEAQELIDHLVIKMRMVNQLRTPEYNELFAGDPTWVTCVLAGMDGDSHLVTKTSFRMLQTLYNLGPAPEPNLTVLWDKRLPEGFKDFCARVSIDTSSIQYESDTLMNPRFGSDYAIACCVSAMRVGKDMQFFGARCNAPKLLLYALNGGRDEVSGAQVAPKFTPIKDLDSPLVYDEVLGVFKEAMGWLVRLYMNTMNCIHYMHDKYNYERLMMALHDTHVRRLLALGIAGISVIADSLSAIRHAEVTPIRNDNGLIVDFETVGDFPMYGNDDNRVDMIAKDVVDMFMEEARSCHAYRGAIPTLSLLSITSNVKYGKMTGSTPCGRKKGEAFAPGANPLHGREKSGALASLNTLAKIPYDQCLDGVSNTFSIIPSLLGDKDDRSKNLAKILDGYFASNAHHINVNVFNRATLEDAFANPEKYPNLTIRVSGYAVRFNSLSPEQKREVIQRTFHDAL